MAVGGGNQQELLRVTAELLSDQAGEVDTVRRHEAHCGRKLWPGAAGED